MNRTNSEKFRANLREWMDIAEMQPVKITRKTGSSFVLVNSEEFEKMQMELISLRAISIGLSDVVQGRVKKLDGDDFESAAKVARKKILQKKKGKNVV